MLNGRLILPAILAMVFAVLTACGAAGTPGTPGVEATSLPQPSATATATVTITPTETPSPTSTITKTPYPPTPISQKQPDIYNSPVAKDLLFSGDEMCRLPFWYGLRIGESHADQIQHVLRRVVGASDDYILNMGEDHKYIEPNQAGYVTFNLLSGSPQKFLAIGTQFNPQTDILASVRVGATFPVFIRRTMPQRVLREYGAPYAVWVRYSRTEVTEVSSLSVDFVYLDGGTGQPIYMSWQTNIPVNASNARSVATWCLNGGAEQEEHVFDMKIAASFDPDLAEQAYEASHALPLKQVFNVTPEELYQRVMKDSNVCLQHES